VTPGTRYVTVGGAIASDIHGKNHHIDGAFGQHVSAMTVMLSNGEAVTLDPVSTPEWFWATVGGMGLTGMMLDATIDLIPITSNLIEVTTQRTTHIDELFAIMGNSHDDDQCRYSVAWVDMLSKGDSFGRGVLTRGNHAQLENVARDGEHALEYDPRTRVSVPRFFPNGVLNAATIRVFNELWFRKAPASPTVTHESITGFFHPLDGVRHWNRMYGSKGFLQYQCVVPLHATHVLKDVISMMQQAKIPAFLAVLKRMGPANPGLLSFPMEGWTLAVDIAVGAAHLSTALSEIDEVVISAGGRHYLAKDAHMTPSTFERGYPQLNTWRSIQREMDPRGIWTSDLDRRLCVVGAR
jgi:decaprenylphospho-beta-D-ribofuranose 2-oxidase